MHPSLFSKVILLSVSTKLLLASTAWAEAPLKVGSSYSFLDSTPKKVVLKNAPLRKPSATDPKKDSAGFRFSSEVIYGEKIDTSTNRFHFAKAAEGKYMAVKAKGSIEIDKRKTSESSGFSLTIRKEKDFGYWSVDVSQPEFTDDAKLEFKKPDDVRRAILGDYVVIGGRRVSAAYCEISIARSSTREGFSLDAYGMVEAKTPKFGGSTSTAVNLLREDFGSSVELSVRYYSTGVKKPIETSKEVFSFKTQPTAQISQAIDQKMDEILADAGVDEAEFIDYEVYPISALIPGSQPSLKLNEVLLDDVTRQLEMVQQKLDVRRFIDNDITRIEFVKLFGAEAGERVAAEVAKLRLKQKELVTFAEGVAVATTRAEVAVPALPDTKPVPFVDLVIWGRAIGRATHDVGPPKEELIIGWTPSTTARTVTLHYANKELGRSPNGDAVTAPLKSKDEIIADLISTRISDETVGKSDTVNMLSTAIANLQSPHGVLGDGDTKDCRYFLFRYSPPQHRDILYVTVSGSHSKVIFGAKCLNRLHD